MGREYGETVARINAPSTMYHRHIMPSLNVDMELLVRHGVKLQSLKDGNVAFHQQLNDLQIYVSQLYQGWSSSINSSTLAMGCMLDLNVPPKNVFNQGIETCPTPLVYSMK